VISRSNSGKGGTIVKKKLAAGVAATIAAASIATNLLVDADELLHSAEYLNTHTKAVATEEAMEVAITVEEEAEKTRVEMLRSWIIRLPVAVKAVFLLPLWALGAIPVTLATAAFTAMAPIWSQILGVLLQAGILTGVFLGAYKLLFPHRKVKDLFKKRNFRWIALGAGAVSVANIVLTTAWTGWPMIRAIAMTVVGFGVLCLLWHRLAHKVKEEAPKKVKTKLMLEY